MTRSRIALAALGLICSLPACREPRPAPQEGFAVVPGGRIWYRVVGDGPGIPLLVLHGGPGMPSYYLSSLARLGKERPVIFYDQLGSGRSDQPTDTALWRIDRYIAELNALREHLHLTQVHLLGHSWGSMLATDYLLTHPAGVRSAILASPCLSASRWLKDADSLVTTLPDSIQRVIRKYEATRQYDAPQYQAAIQFYYSKFLSRRSPPSPDYDSTMAHLGMGAYLYMWGPSEFTATGTLKNYERADRLKELQLPVLFTAGEFDEARPATVAYYQKQLPGAELAIIPGSAHMATLDAPEAFADTVSRFLAEVEKKR
jgi:proline iminopeptidase